MYLCFPYRVPEYCCGNSNCPNQKANHSQDTLPPQDDDYDGFDDDAHKNDDDVDDDGDGGRTLSTLPPLFDHQDYVDLNDESLLMMMINIFWC